MAGGKQKAQTSSTAQHLMPALAVSKNKSAGGLITGCWSLASPWFQPVLIAAPNEDAAVTESSALLLPKPTPSSRFQNRGKGKPQTHSSNAARKGSVGYTFQKWKCRFLYSSAISKISAVCIGDTFSNILFGSHQKWKMSFTTLLPLISTSVYRQRRRDKHR